MQHSGKWNTTSQILKPKNIKLRDINGLTSSQIKKMSVRCRSQDDLRRVDPVGAHRLLKARYSGETLPLCYYLYSFEGALSDKHWDAIGAERKQQLKAQVG